MFESHFGLRENPFVSGHQAKFLFPSREHQEALAHLRYGIENREPFVLITGEVGTGKTTAIYDALAEWKSQTVVALITNSALTRSELLEEICLRFNFAVDSPISKPQAMAQLERHLLALKARGERGILLLDEAQNLERDLLEEVRLLSNLEINGEKLLQVFLIGQPELENRLAQPELRQLKQRIAVHYRLQPLSGEDTARYIHHRITIAGGYAPDVFPADACAEVFRLTHGIPREINQICAKAMLAAFVEDAHHVMPSHVLAAAGETEFKSVLGEGDDDTFEMPVRRVEAAAVVPAPAPTIAPAPEVVPAPAPSPEPTLPPIESIARAPEIAPPVFEKRTSSREPEPGPPTGDGPSWEAWVASLVKAHELPPIEEPEPVPPAPPAPEPVAPPPPIVEPPPAAPERRVVPIVEPPASPREATPEPVRTVAPLAASNVTPLPLPVRKPESAPTRLEDFENISAGKLDTDAWRPPAWTPQSGSNSSLSPRLRRKLEEAETPSGTGRGLRWTLLIGVIAVLAIGAVLSWRFGPMSKQKTAMPTAADSSVAPAGAAAPAESSRTAPVPATAAPPESTSLTKAGAPSMASIPAATIVPTAKPVPSAAPATPSRFGLAVGTFLNLDRAVTERDRLKNLAHLPTRILTTRSDGVASYSVLVGSFDSRSAAEDKASDLITRGLVDEARVVPQRTPAKP